MVDGEELTFESINESWNEYACEDGTNVKIKLVIAKITRLTGEKTEDGEPVYVVKASPVVSATPPPNQT